MKATRCSFLTVALGLVMMAACSSNTSSARGGDGDGSADLQADGGASDGSTGTDGPSSSTASTSITDATAGDSGEGAVDSTTDAGPSTADGSLDRPESGGGGPTGVRLEPASFDFMITRIPSPGEPAPPSPVQMFVVRNSDVAAVGPLAAEISGTDLDAFAISSNDCDGVLLQPGSRCAIVVRFKPSSSGSKEAQLDVTSTGTIRLASAVLSGVGAEAAKLTLTPSTQVFGTVPVGAKSAYSFEVSNEGGADLGKITASIQGINVSEFSLVTDPACDQPLYVGARCGITVTFAPTIPGPKAATLRVTASPGGSTKADLTATAQPMSSGSSITLTSPAPDPFGTLQVGDSSTGFFVVENKGAVAAGQVMAAVSGSNSAEFVITDNNCPATLAIGGTCGMTVRFTPQVAGRRTANLQASATPGGFVTLPLAGSATASASLRISPTVRNFNSVRINTINGSVQDFTISAGNVLAPTGPLTVVVEGADGTNWQVTYNECQNTQLMPGHASCRVGVRFAPLTIGAKTASLAVSAMPGGVARASIYGSGTN